MDAPSAALFAITASACAQWQPLASPVTTDLLSVDARDAAVWVSGKDDIVLRSADHGITWERCAGPAKNMHACLRSIAAVDASTAVVMIGDGAASKTKHNFTGPAPGEARLAKAGICLCRKPKLLSGSE